MTEELIAPNEQQEVLTRILLIFNKALIDIESISMIDFSEVGAAIDNGKCHLPHVNKHDHDDHFLVSIHYNSPFGHAELQTLINSYDHGITLMKEIQAKMNAYWRLKSKHE